MKAQSDCIACLFTQALATARVVTDDETVLRKILMEVAQCVGSASLDDTPAHFSQPVYDIISRITGVRDPYAEVKRKTNALALSMLPSLKELIKVSPDPLEAALHIAAAGNVIDSGANHGFDVERDVAATLEVPFAINDTGDFKLELGPDRTLLYLADNAGEIALDTLLIPLLLETGTRVTCAVKAGPIINDATMEDAVAVGMDKLVPVITTGSDAIGVDWTNGSDELMQLLDTSDIILAKGHGNFETCDRQPGNFYFLLKAKCDIVASRLGVPLGSTVFTHQH